MFDLFVVNFDFQLVGEKAKGWISKLVLQEHKARKIFWKTNISYPLIRAPESELESEM